MSRRGRAPWRPDLRPWTDPQRAVLLGAAIEPAAAALEELGALAPTLDWDAAAALAVRLGVGPLLYRTVKRARLTVPEGPRRRLLGAYGATGVRNDAVMLEVLRLSDALEAAGIAALPLKGACLMGTLYPDAALRVVSDIDLLVPGARARDAARVLAAHGYRHDDAGLMLERSELFMHHVTLSRDAAPFRFHVELHHRLLTTFVRRQDSDAVLARATFVPYGAGRVRRPQAEDEVLHLAAHLAAHVAEPHLKWLVDLRELLLRTTLDWDLLVARARAGGAATGVYEALRRLAVLPGAALPAGVLERLRPRPGRRHLIAHLAPLAVALGDELPRRWQLYALALLLQEGWRDRLLQAGLSLGYKVWLERARRGARRDAAAR